ncbi:nicotinate phosphoribosyltransferase [Rhodohalobacter sp. SW132]|uniref:nicotinate phosphoribosyltransferase n=1 Tax=Rhodohalobacter sp. SW132 TaxID=2293433 RepID=UPI000E224E25|nr:nicotinate phosphoribosyltransferase [Rhodohalobacter sp. SW132]REL33619.1 nicotinate phosphoribosyltransferase [Rhodohalobacter sp. SW132]
MYIDKPTSFTDYYELTMAQGYFLEGDREKKGVFDYFFRKVPFDGGYVVFTGLNDLLEALENFTFRDSELSYLKKEGFDSGFLNYLADFKFTGSLYSPKEGEVVFPNVPLIRVEGDLIETQLIETLLLNILNFQSLIATKASRMRYAAGEDATLLDFGLRRSQGLGGIHATRAAYIGGFDGTSNVYSSQQFGIPASGTMAHSWVQSFDDELEAFRTYARHFPDSTVLLVDTYNTLKSGLPNAITVAKELKEKGHSLKGIRLDSGDLAYLSKQSRKLLDNAGFTDVKIAASNQLDERVIASLKNQNSPIDIFGVGTRLVTGHNSPALDGVYKLSESGSEPKLKVSENIEKITLPGAKSVRRYLNGDGMYYADAIGMKQDDPFELIHHPTFPAKEVSLEGREFYPLLNEIMNNGEIKSRQVSISDSKEYCRESLAKLPREYKRFDNPHIYKVGVTPKLLTLRDQLLDQHKI